MLRRLGSYEQVAPLLLRLGVGFTFFLAGLAKVLGGTDKMAGFFGSLGIPLPGLMGPFISYLELLGGLALIIGVLTRLFSLLFMGDMLVAMMLVTMPKTLQAPNFAVGFPNTRAEFLLLFGSAALVLLGAGVFSIDAVLFGDRSRGFADERSPRLAQ